MSFAAEPDTRYDIRQETSRMMTLDYASNSDKMDMYIEANGRAIDAKGDIDDCQKSTKDLQA